MNTFDEIIQTKAYSDLNSNELEIIRELVSSEAEYNEMKSFYAEIDQLAISDREDVSVSVKSSLNSVFQAKHPGISQNWNAPAEVAEKKIIPLYNRTIFRAAALLVLCAGVITVWVSMSDNQLAQKESAELTAKMDSVSLKKQKAPAVEKKEFPLNDAGSQKDFTAASDIPKDENADQSVTFQSNATLNATTSGAASSTTYNWNIADKTKSSNLATASGTYSTKVSFGNTAAKTGTTYFAAPSPKPGKQSTTDKDKKSNNIVQLGSLTKAGLNADLNPGGFYAEAGSASTKDYKPSIQTTDLLTLIEPSF